MTRLRIGVEQLGAEGLRLELESDGGARNVIALAPGGGIRGSLEQDGETIALRGIRADMLVVSELSWALGSGRLRGACRLHDVEIEAVVGAAAREAGVPFVGTLRARAVEATLDLQTAGTSVHAVTVHLADFALTASGEGGVGVVVSSARASTVRLHVAGLEIVAHDVVAPAPVQRERGALRLEEIAIGGLELRSADLAALLSRPAPSAAPASARTRPSLPFLDLLRGHLGLDVVTDVTVPILGRREATHAFRIPIEDGIVDFGMLEKSLATLENMVIDFEVEGDKLVLEKDVPLLPFDNLALVQWSLDAEGIELARRKRVRLRTLLAPELPAKARAEVDKERAEKGSAVQLRRLSLRDIDVSLAVGGPFELPVLGGRLRFGAGDRPAIAELRVTGELGHIPGRAQPGRLVLAARSILAEASGLAWSGRRLDLAAEIGVVEEVTAVFDGLRPSSLTARLAGVVLRKLELGAGSA